MIDNNITEKSSSRFSYLIRPITPCVFGTEDYQEKPKDDDEFFITAGGIVHSCPNIYELSIENDYKYGKLQSCEHLIFMTRTTKSINNHLNTYDTELNHYSIIPRFQPISSSLSTDSINSEIELYQERHANGLSRKYHNSTSSYSSFLPTRWKSDNYLLLMSVLNHHQSSLSTSIDSLKRSHSFNIPVRQTISSIFL
jgi:hypothetical protein